MKLVTIIIATLSIDLLKHKKVATEINTKNGLIHTYIHINAGMLK